MSQYKIDFSESNIKLLTDLTETLNTILVGNGFWVYTDLLEKIRIAAHSKNEDDFINFLIDNALFRGSGALWEIYIDDKNERLEFNKIFCQYIDQIKSMGINNERINQVRETLPLLI